MLDDFWQKKYRAESAKAWNCFYKRHDTRFFRDRHWTWREFPELLDPNVKSLLEVGCGVGNFVLPLLEERVASSEALSVWACDFSPKAIELLMKDTRYDPKRCTAFVADITQPACFSLHITDRQIDVASSIFVLSAIPPESLSTAIANIRSVLRPGSRWIVRDYAAGDAAQRRFKADRQLGHDLFVRQDGTLSRFFDRDELSRMIAEHGFDVDSAEYHESRTVNVAKGIDQERKFLQITATAR